MKTMLVDCTVSRGQWMVAHLVERTVGFEGRLDEEGVTLYRMLVTVEWLRVGMRLRYGAVPDQRNESKTVLLVDWDKILVFSEPHFFFILLCS